MTWDWHAQVVGLKHNAYPKSIFRKKEPMHLRT